MLLLHALAGSVAQSAIVLFKAFSRTEASAEDRIRIHLRAKSSARRKVVTEGRAFTTSWAHSGRAPGLRIIVARFWRRASLRDGEGVKRMSPEQWGRGRLTLNMAAAPRDWSAVTLVLSNFNACTRTD